jgi:phage tail-like protein
MSVAAYLPPPRRPPHDPLTLRLSAFDGWRAAPAAELDGVDLARLDAGLTLKQLAPSGPGLLDPAGSLGGLVPPVHVAVAPDGAIYLLDRAGRRVLRFDPCLCAFAPLPCLPAAPAGRADPRALPATAAIAASARLIAVADGRDGGAVVLIGWQDLATRAVLARSWRPGPVAFDRGGRLHVADQAAGAIHRFAADGLWLGRIEGVGSVLGLAVDRQDRLHVASADRLRRFSAEGTPIQEVVDAAALADAFPPLPFGLDALGRLVLREACRAAGVAPRGHGVFDAAGTALKEAPVPWPAARHATSGRFVTTAIDSRIRGCIWHRIQLEGELPAGTRLALRARTDEVELPVGMAAAPDDPAWSPAQSWSGASDGAPFECLFTAPPGRFLWLEVTLAGPGDATPRLDLATLEFPRISLRRYLPAVFAPNPVAAEFADRFLSLFDQQFRSVERQLDDVASIFDPHATPERMLGWLAGWVGLALPAARPAAERRRLLAEAPRLYAARGTVAGLSRLLLLHLGMDRLACRPRPCRFGPACPPVTTPPEPPRLVLEHWRLRRWLFLGRGRLGESSRLWGEKILNRSRLDDGAQLGATQLKLERDPLRDPFHESAHAFSVFLPAARARRPSERRRIEALIRSEAPAHARPVMHWVEPAMRLGVQSTLGFDSVIGTAAPEALALGAARLGRAAAPGRDDRRPDIGLKLGRGARLGPASSLC